MLAIQRSLYRSIDVVKIVEFVPMLSIASNAMAAILYIKINVLTNAMACFNFTPLLVILSIIRTSRVYSIAHWVFTPHYTL